MEVSTFELLFKPQAPVSPQSTSAVERVLQGYFLTITNLEDKPYSYALEFMISAPGTSAPNAAFRTLTGNTLVFVDTSGEDNKSGTLLGSTGETRFAPSTGLIRIPPRGTALVAVLPSVFPVPIDPTPITSPLFEVRGYVTLRLPALPQFNPIPPRIQFKPQSSAPVRVLLTPQHRATFLSASNIISDQIQASLPTASGGALNAITPESGGPFVPLAEPLTPRQIEEALMRLMLLPEDERAAMLVAQLAQFGDSASELVALNELLVTAQVPLAVETVGQPA